MAGYGGFASDSCQLSVATGSRRIGFAGEFGSMAFNRLLHLIGWDGSRPCLRNGVFHLFLAGLTLADRIELADAAETLNTVSLQGSSSDDFWVETSSCRHN